MAMSGIGAEFGKGETAKAATQKQNDGQSGESGKPAGQDWRQALASAYGAAPGPSVAPSSPLHAAAPVQPPGGQTLLLAQAIPGGAGAGERPGNLVPMPGHAAPGATPAKVSPLFPRSGQPNLRTVVTPGASGSTGTAPKPASPGVLNQPGLGQPVIQPRPGVSPDFGYSGVNDLQPTGNALIPPAFLIQNNLYRSSFSPINRFDAMVLAGVRAARSGGLNQGTTVAIPEAGMEIILRYHPATGMVSQQIAGQAEGPVDYMPLRTLARHHRIDAAQARGGNHGALATALANQGVWPRGGGSSVGPAIAPGISNPHAPIISPRATRRSGSSGHNPPAGAGNASSGRLQAQVANQASTQASGQSGTQQADWNALIMPAIQRVVSRQPAWVQPTLMHRIAHHVDQAMSPSARTEQDALAVIARVADGAHEPGSVFIRLGEAAVQDWQEGFGQVLDHSVSTMTEYQPQFRKELEQWLYSEIEAGRINGTVQSIQHKINALANSPVTLQAMTDRAVAAGGRIAAAASGAGESSPRSSSQTWVHPDRMPLTAPLEQAPEQPSTNPANPLPATRQPRVRPDQPVPAREELAPRLVAGKEAGENTNVDISAANGDEEPLDTESPGDDPKERPEQAKGPGLGFDAGLTVTFRPESMPMFSQPAKDPSRQGANPALSYRTGLVHQPMELTEGVFDPLITPGQEVAPGIDFTPRHLPPPVQPGITSPDETAPEVVPGFRDRDTTSGAAGFTPSPWMLPDLNPGFRPTLDNKLSVITLAAWEQHQQVEALNRQALDHAYANYLGSAAEPDAVMDQATWFEHVVHVRDMYFVSESYARVALAIYPPANGHERSRERTWENGEGGVEAMITAPAGIAPEAVPNFRPMPRVEPEMTAGFAPSPWMLPAMDPGFRPAQDNNVSLMSLAAWQDNQQREDANREALRIAYGNYLEGLTGSAAAMDQGQWFDHVAKVRDTYFASASYAMVALMIYPSAGAAVTAPEAAKDAPEPGPNPGQVPGQNGNGRGSVELTPGITPMEDVTGQPVFIPRP